jgi:hypothetical protein
MIDPIWIAVAFVIGAGLEFLLWGKSEKPKEPEGKAFWAIRDNEESKGHTGYVWLFPDKPTYNENSCFGFDGTFAAMIPCSELAGHFPELVDLKYGDEPRRVQVAVL